MEGGTETRSRKTDSFLESEGFELLKLEYIMHERDKSQTELAKASGINRVTINRLIRGRETPSDGRAAIIAKALNWPTDRAAELFEEVEVR